MAAAVSCCPSPASPTTDPDGARAAVRVLLALASSMPLSHCSDLAWCEIGGTLIFLDIANDRYFRLADDRNRQTHNAFEQAGHLPWKQPSYLPRPAGWMDATRTSDSIDAGSFSISEVARALWVQRRAEKRLAQYGLAALLADSCRTRETRPCEYRLSTDSARQTVRAFEHARLLRTAADRCLPRSVALMLCLAARGVHAHIVIGVQLAPFGAHCWVQAGNEVLNDSIEETARYQPILIL
jgi:hypothetical protein